MDNYNCCDKFKENHTNDNHGIEYRNGWHVNGCCGGCYVLTDIIFCPYCGTKLPIKESKDADSHDARL